MKYAAYDENSIYAISDTPEAAVIQARHDAKEPAAQFETAPIDDDFAAQIERNGFDGKHDSYCLRDGTLCASIEDV